MRRFSYRRGVVLLAASFLLAPNTAVSQARLRADAVCSSCRIVVSPTIVLPSDRSTEIGLPEVVASTANGGYLVVSSEHAHELTEFDVNGHYIGSTGREGKGPGEFAFIRQIRVRGDTIYVLDQQLNRVTLIRDKQALATIDLPFRPIDFLPLRDGRYLVNGLAVTRANVGHPFHLIDAQGQVERSFGYSGEVISFDIPFTSWRSLGTGTSGFWAGHVNRYLVERWTLDGARDVHVERDAEWFSPLNEPVRGYSPNNPPPAMLRGLLERDGRLLVVSVVPNADFAQGLRRVRESAHSDHYVLEDFSRVYDTILEVIDYDTGRLLATERIDAYTVSVLESGKLATWRLEGGNSFVDIWAVQFKER